MNESRHVLVVNDDEEQVRHWSKTLAESWSLVSAPSLEYAWRRTEAHEWREAPCDYVVVDFDLPDGDGIDLLPRLASLEPRPPVAVISRHLGAARCLSLRGHCTIALTKPVDASVLRNLFEILEEARSGDSTVTRFATHYRLSPRERSLLNLALQELTNEESAERLGCAYSTVRSYWSRIFHKVGCHCERDVIARVLRFALSSTT